MTVIPRIIHACWFGGAQMSSLNKRCIESWKHHCPDFEIKIWSDTDLDLSDSVIRGLYRNKKWAFIADIVRFEVLGKVGGVYLDTDMELVQPFDEGLMSRDFFIGRESKNWINAGVVGAVPNHQLIKAIQERVRASAEGGVFVELPKLLTDVVTLNTSAPPYVAPTEVFYPYNPYDPDRQVKQLMYSDITEATVTIHHWEKSWKLSVFDLLKRRILRKQ